MIQPVIVVQSGGTGTALVTQRMLFPQQNGFVPSASLIRMI